MATATPTSIAWLFKAICDRLVDLHQEGTEQRNILRDLTGRVCELKQSVDKLKESHRD